MQTANLQAFIMVAETDSFSRAAERLHLTQSAVSKRISALEDEISARLFDRIGHQVNLTEAGRTLLPRAHRILAEVEDGRRAILNLSGSVAGRLSFATSHHIGLHRLPPHLEDFHRRFPEVELDPRFMASETICEAVAHGDLEFGLVTLPLTTPGNLEAHVLWQDPLSFACGHEHPLASCKRVRAQQLTLHTAILPGSHTTTHQTLASKLLAMGIELRASMSTDYLETIKMMITVGLGWSLLPKTMLDDHLHAFTVNGMNLDRKLGAVVHRERTLSNAARQFLADIRNP